MRQTRVSPLKPFTKDALASALRGDPRPRTWDEVVAVIRIELPNPQAAKMILDEIISHASSSPRMHQLCELAGLDPREIATKTRSVAVFEAGPAVPKDVFVPRTVEVDDASALRVGAVELEVWRSVRRLLDLARQTYFWPLNRGAIFDWVERIVFRLTPVRVSPFLQRMRNKDLMRVTESGKVGGNQTLWTPCWLPDVRPRAGERAARRLTDEELYEIIRAGLHRHRHAIRQWNRHVIIPRDENGEPVV